MTPPPFCSARQNILLSNTFVFKNSMDNFSIRLLNEKGMVACNHKTFGGQSKVFEKVHPLSQKHMPPLKGQLSSLIVYFGATYHVGEKFYE